MGNLAIKRVYAPPAESDGKRILVDRLWPRGLSRSEAAIDDWIKEIAPSPALRKWFGHDPARFAEFGNLYLEELDGNPAPVVRLCGTLQDKASHSPRQSPGAASAGTAIAASSTSTRRPMWRRSIR